MPPQTQWKDASPISFPADIDRNSHKQLIKRGANTSFEPGLFAVPIVIVLIIGLVVFLTLAYKNRNKSPLDPDVPPPSEFLSGKHEEVGLEKNKGRTEIEAISAMGNQLIREPDDTPKLHVENNVYQPPRLQVPEMDSTRIVGTPIARPTRGLVYRPSLPEADGTALVERDDQHQLHVPEANGVGVAGGQYGQHQPQVMETDETDVNGYHNQQRQQVPEMNDVPPVMVPIIELPGA